MDGKIDALCCPCSLTRIDSDILVSGYGVLQVYRGDDTLDFTANYNGYLDGTLTSRKIASIHLWFNSLTGGYK